jgi:penicillin-binding protein-related factor A (putative recombinase)
MAIPYYPDDAPEHTIYVPKLLGGNGKDFEQALLDQAERMKSELTMGRYGVSVSLIQGEWRPVPSKPDFDGTFMGGGQFNVEAKVCTKPSFSLEEDKFKSSQYDWMRNKALYGVPCYLLIHFNEREGKTFKEDAFTVSIHVHPELQLWRDYESGSVKSISRDMALQLGTRVPWTIPKGSRKPLPHFI